MAAKVQQRVIIVAGGANALWNSERAKFRHLVEIEKEVLLSRTIKQFSKYTDDVRVIGADESYVSSSAGLYVVRSTNTHWGDFGKFLCTKNLWLADGRTVIAFGDTYFTNDAVQLIMKNRDSFKWFLRTAPEKEIYAFAFDSSQAKWIDGKLLHCVSISVDKKNAEWDLYRATIGSAVTNLFANSHFEEITDEWTHDFDTEDDLVAWEERRKASRKRSSEDK
jgi:hypothetical protein